MTVVHICANQGYAQGLLERFYPLTIEMLRLPAGVPEGIKKEFEEAEICASGGVARRIRVAARSTLEKTLEANGYEKGALAARIDEAAGDGVITAARARAHEDICVLGNDVLHDAWRVVTEEEFDVAHRYAQRILEDLYDDRPSVEALLREKGRTPLACQLLPAADILRSVP